MKITFIVYFIYLGVLPVCTSVHHHMPGSRGGLEQVLGPLELELQMVVRLCVGAGHQIQVLWKSSQCS